MCIIVTDENHICAIHLGDHNAHDSTWWPGDKDNDTVKCLMDVLDNTGLHQLVHEPTHFMNNSRSCIVFVLKPIQPYN